MIKNIIPSLILVLISITSCSTDTNISPQAGDSDAAIDISLDPLSDPKTFFATPAVVEIPPPNFTLYGESPILQKGSGWDSVIVSPGAVIYHEGFFHMLYNGSEDLENGKPLESVGYAVSVDGYQWIRTMDEPVSFSQEQELDLAGLFVSSLLVDQDGTWIMYFTGTALSGINGSFIGRATAPEIAGPWTIDDAPALLPGNVARWDGGGISNPQVFRTIDEYVMFFNGTNGDPRWREPTQMGIATSPDGITWTKYDDPETTKRLYEDSDPVFKVGAKSTWDSTSVRMVSMQHTQQGWVMLYFGRLRQNMREFINFGFASSLDGITWDRFQNNPILNPEEFFPDYYLSSMVWLTHQDTQFLYIGVFHRSLFISEIYLLTSE